MQPVSFVDRKDLLAYLRGEIDHSDCIELVAPPVRRGTEVAAKRAREGDDAGGDGAAAEQEVLRVVVSRKRAILDRNSALFAPGKARSPLPSCLPVTPGVSSVTPSRTTCERAFACRTCASWR